MFYTLFFFKWHLSEKKKTEQKQKSATIMISVDAKGTVFSVKLKLQGNCLNKDVKKRILKKI